MNGASSTEHSFNSQVGSGSERHCLLGRDVISESPHGQPAGNIDCKYRKAGKASVNLRTPAILSMKNLWKFEAEMSGDAAC